MNINKGWTFNKDYVKMNYSHYVSWHQKMEIYYTLSILKLLIRQILV